ncbi:hypothetical protein WDU94_002101 [Cyamophila willieti]
MRIPVKGDKADTSPPPVDQQPSTSTPSQQRPSIKVKRPSFIKLQLSFRKRPKQEGHFDKDQTGMIGTKLGIVNMKEIAKSTLKVSHESIPSSRSSPFRRTKSSHSPSSVQRDQGLRRAQSRKPLRPFPSAPAGRLLSASVLELPVWTRRKHFTREVEEDLRVDFEMAQFGYSARRHDG